MEILTLSSAECKALLEAIVDCDEALYAKIKECANHINTPDIIDNWSHSIKCRCTGYPIICECGNGMFSFILNRPFHYKCVKCGKEGFDG